MATQEFIESKPRGKPGRKPKFGPQPKRTLPPKTGISTMRSKTKSRTDDSNMPLTAQQRRFVEAWAAGDTICAAAARSGYEGNTSFCYDMAKRPNILALYQAEKLKYEEAAQCTRKSVMDMHLEAFEMAKLMSEPATMVSAARELGKMAGYYAPVESRVKIDITGNVVLDRMNSMSDAELLKIISQASPTALLSAPALDDEDSDPS